MANKTALVLEGGSLRILFSSGVTDVMLKRGLGFDGVFGVSAGALLGLNIVSQQPGRTAQVNLQFVNDKRYLGMNNLILRHSIFNFDFLFGEISEKLIPFDWEAFENSPVKFTAAATSCLTGKPLYCEKGSCGDIYMGVRASASLPLLAPMVNVDGTPCLDGGCSVSIPYQKAIDDGYEKLVIITTREHGFRKPPVSAAQARLYMRIYRNYPQLVKSILNTPRRYDKELNEIDRLEKEGKAFVIRPQNPITISQTEKNTKKLQALYDEGQRIGEEAMDALIEYLQK